MRLLILFICALPFIELWLMIRIGTVIGALPTIALLVFAGIAGSALLQRQGLRTAWQAQQRMQAGELPAEEVFSGLLLAIAGLFLLIPGFLTDLIALPLLIPPLRRALARKLIPAMNVQGGAFYQFRSGSFNRNGDVIEGEVIEGEVIQSETSEKTVSHTQKPQDDPPRLQ